MSDGFTDEQNKLFNKETIKITPSFGDEWVVETFDVDGNLLGRFNAVDADHVVGAIKSVLIGDDMQDFNVN